MFPLRGVGQFTAGVTGTPVEGRRNRLQGGAGILRL